MTVSGSEASAKHAAPAPLDGVASEAPFRTPEAFNEMLGHLERLALFLGGAAEHVRIAGIMNAQEADGRLALAWRLAESGLTIEAARQALMIAKIASAAPAVDAGAALQH